jgi:hypothetical protein
LDARIVALILLQEWKLQRTRETARARSGAIGLVPPHHTGICESPDGERLKRCGQNLIWIKSNLGLTPHT